MDTTRNHATLTLRLAFLPLLITAGLCPGIAQDYGQRIIYSRLQGNLPQVRLNDGGGTDTLLIASAAIPQLVMEGRYLLYLSGTTALNGLDNILLGGQWMRRTLATGAEFTMFNSSDYTQGYDMFLSDSTSAVAYACNIYNNSFDNATVLGTMTVDCNDDFPRIRQSDELVVGHNVFTSLFTVQRNGTARTAIPNTLEYDTWPTWSPDGQWILFGRSNGMYAAGAGYGFNVVNYYKIKQSGDSLTQLTWNLPTDSATFTGNAIWTENGQSIIVAGTRNGRYGLMEIAADGSMWSDTIPTAPGGPIFYLTGARPYGLSVGIVEPWSARTHVQVFPNPTSGDVTLIGMEWGQSVAVYDALGRYSPVAARRSTGGSIELGVSALPAGVYFIRSKDGSFIARVIRE
ncbi:MAG TPA: T9SS type A sorting domain-containing protein [Flavobacteriales bacterium]|nr:T9SS type A sorting domain-containing protein [Flavobacteriales bacterium]HMR26130.1 T9SS type A sorting domain-containing protein [Flavobacteriales bacterium]